MNFGKLPILRNMEEWDKIAIKMKIDLFLKGKKNFKRDFKDKYFSSRHPETPLEISAMWQLYKTIIHNQIW